MGLRSRVSASGEVGKVRACVSIDVDPLGGDALWERAIPRHLALLAAADLRATFFVVASECARPIPRAWVRRIADARHEIANHTLDHPRGFGRLARPALVRQVADAEQMLQDAGGARVVGFRAPAWDATPELFDVLEQRGYVYDSSVCPTWVAPAARIVGRPRRVRPFGALRFGLAPRVPYRPDARAPWRRGTMSLVEVPTSIGALRLPVWLTPVLATGPRLDPAWRALLRGTPAPQWLFHAADLLDFDREVSPSLAYRPGLRRPLAQKEQLIGRALADLSRLGPAAGTVLEVARALA